MDPTCFGSLQVCALRVAALDSNGEPLVGSDNGYVTNSLINVDVGIDLSTGVDLEKKNGCGSVCQTYKGPDIIKRANLKAALCELDLQLASLIIGGDLITTHPGLVSFGWQFPHIADAAPNGVCFEVWTKAWDGGQQATPSSLSNAAGYWHWVFPRATFQLSDMTMDENFLEFAVEGFGEENASMWWKGPFNDWPAAVQAEGGVTAVGAIFLDDTLPEGDCDFIAIPNQAS